jgi:hypothetical protein
LSLDVNEPATSWSFFPLVELLHIEEEADDADDDEDEDEVEEDEDEDEQKVASSMARRF